MLLTKNVEKIILNKTKNLRGKKLQNLIVKLTLEEK